MSNNKLKNRNKKYAKMLKKSMWPAILLFCVMVLISVTLVYTFVSLFIYYMASTKLQHIKSASVNISKDVQRLYESNEDVFLTNEQIKSHLSIDNQVCFTDSKGNIVAKTGADIPDTTECLSINFNERIVIHQDYGKSVISNEDELMTEMYSVFLKALEGVFSNITTKEEHEEEPHITVLPEAEAGPTNSDERTIEINEFAEPKFSAKWMNTDMFNVGFWVETRIPGYDGRIYIRDIFVIERQDVLYASAVALLAIIFLFVPMTVLFISMIIGIVNQRRMMRLLYKDPITEDNNWLFYKALSLKYINQFKNRKRSFAVVNLHLNKYLDFCSYYGVDAGEQFIRAINGYLRIRTDVGEVHARHSGADFALLLKYKDNADLSKRIRTMIAELMGLEQDPNIKFSAGVYLIPSEDSKDYGKLLCNRKNIDIEQLYNYACEAAIKNKKNGTNLIGFFSDEMLEEERWERKVENTMEKALLNHEFVAYYQPKYNPIDNKLVSAEALVRWISPEDGLIPPGKFIPIFEKNGFISKLDDYMILEIAKQQAEWKIAGKKIVPVSVNISREHFMQDDLANEICNMIDSYGTDRKMIEFEITESAFLDDKKLVVDVVRELQKDGFTIAIDDFGTGYSSLNSLKELPCDILKLDAEFFRIANESDIERSKKIVIGMINLAKSMDMKVVAEGVETRALCEFLASKGCDMIQGYYYSKPLTAEEFILKVEEDS